MKSVFTLSILSSLIFLKNKLFQNSFRNTIRISNSLDTITGLNSLDPNQDRCSVGPDEAKLFAKVISR